LTQQGVFQHQFRSATGEIQGRTYNEEIVAAVGMRPLAQALLGTTTE
jgi:hypothetical protein